MCLIKLRCDITVKCFLNTVYGWYNSQVNIKELTYRYSRLTLAPDKCYGTAHRVLHKCIRQLNVWCLWLSSLRWIFWYKRPAHIHILIWNCSSYSTSIWTKNMTRDQRLKQATSQWGRWRGGLNKLICIGCRIRGFTQRIWSLLIIEIC